MSGAPQCGQGTCAGVVAVHRGGSRVAPVGAVIICRMGSVVRRQGAFSKPKWRTFMQARRQDMLEETAHKLKEVEASGAWTGTARFAIG